MLATVDQLVDEFRSDVFDRPDVDDAGVARDMLWSDADVLRYLNSAAARWASDTLALRRRFAIAVVLGAPLVRFPYSEILDDLSVSFSVPGFGRMRRLHKFDIDEGIKRDDYGVQIYESPDLDATGMPTHFTRDYDNKYMRLFPIPYVAGTLNAHAIALPSELYPGMPLPMEARQDLDLLLMWMKKLAYAKQDADTLDLDRSEKFEAEYKRFMPDRKSEIDRTRRNGGIMYPS